MSTTTTTQPDQGRRLVIAVLGLGLAFLFIGSLIHRLQNPGLTTQARLGETSAAMNEVAGLMARLDAEPNHLPTLLALGDQFMRMGAWDRAAVFWRRALAVDPSHDKALNGLGVAHYNLDQFPESAEQFRRILALHPDNHRAHFNLGMLYKHYLNDPGQARQHFQRVLELAVGDEDLVERIRQELSELEPSAGQ
ncbi:MAG TPA: tetratricopeptide repeat protein [Desulfonatronum sp.]|mgnify:CR=1 FL=1|nr:tetratricopeptide repeat protein [Desulfonatronum sp.]